MRSEETACCIVGGGPAGMMAGLLLARQGIDVLVLEKHEDFLRDFRSDTIHPATLVVLDELGAAKQSLALPHTKMDRVTMETPAGPVTLADFTKLPGQYGYIAFVPQWDFLNFLADWARRYPSFRLFTRAEVTDLIEEEGRVVGVRAETADGPLQVRATLVLAADGRHSIVRRRAGLEVVGDSKPIGALVPGRPPPRRQGSLLPQRPRPGPDRHRPGRVLAAGLRRPTPGLRGGEGGGPSRLRGRGGGASAALADGRSAIASDLMVRSG